MFDADTFRTPIIWAQIEPSTAVLCAYLTTYRPLFKGFNLSFIMSLARGSRRTPSKHQKPFGIKSGPSSAGTPWTPSSMFSYDLERLNSKASSGNVHVIDIGTRSPSPSDLSLSYDDGMVPSEHLSSSV